MKTKYSEFATRLQEIAGIDIVYGSAEFYKDELNEASVIPKPQYKVTLEGISMTAIFDVNNNPTKRGIKLRFKLDQGTNDANVLNQIANKITVILQKKFATHGIQVNRDTEVEDPTLIGFIIPIASVSDFFMGKVLKGQ